MMAKTGIFWIYQNALIAKTCERENSALSVGGLLDSPDNHSDYWDSTLQYSAQFPEFVAMEYFQVPRGRVLLMQKGAKALVYLDRTLISDKYKALIQQNFQLEGMAISWRADAHYTTEIGELDGIFDN